MDLARDNGLLFHIQLIQLRILSVLPVDYEEVVIDLPAIYHLPGFIYLAIET